MWILYNVDMNVDDLESFPVRIVLVPHRLEDAPQLTLSDYVCHR